MTTASICTIGDEILIGQIVDTNSSYISRELNAIGIRISGMVSIGDDHDRIVSALRNELENNDIVITTGGLGPTKDDITKAALAELSGSTRYVVHEGQKEVVYRILHSRGLEVLDINEQQAFVPDKCEVIVNRLGTAPVMVFHFGAEEFGHPATLYSLPGVPFEALGAVPDVLADIKSHYSLSNITHRNIMVYGMAESALSKLIEPWEDALPSDMHLAYLPNQLTGIRLRLSVYGGEEKDNVSRIEERFVELKGILGDMVYSDADDTLQGTIGRLLRGSGKTLSAAESCTGGEIAHLITTVPGASEYFLGSVTSYAPSVKNRVLGVPMETIESFGIVSSEVAAAMAEGVRKLTGSTYAVATTGWADAYGDEHEPAGTVWVGIAGPEGTKTARFNYRNDRNRNIERFSASALNELRKMIVSDLKA
ncbi:MAG: CinA family nicotinamide mononucleotide deamidase-related protein [Bacteroidales bacterium]|nr:CinA family nicotinamide mononucleotide deamidase-related protein [Bacteroidales bacterium]